MVRDSIVTPRSKFITQIGSGVASLVALAACGGSGTTSFLAHTPTDKLDQALHRLGAYGVLENGVYTVRSDMQSKSWLKHPLTTCGEMVDAAARQVKDFSGCGGDTSTGGAIDNSLPVIASITIYGGGGGIAELSGSEYSDYIDFAGIYRPGTGGVYYGPVFQTPPAALSCLQTTLNTVGTQLRNFAESIVAGLGINCASTGCATAILNSAKGLLAGTVSLAGFADVLLAAFSVVNLADALAAAGIVMGVDTLYLYIRCAV